LSDGKFNGAAEQGYKDEKQRNEDGRGLPIENLCRGKENRGLRVSAMGVFTLAKQ
jgi:hypothetical protein